MNQNISPVLQGEIYSANRYLERIIYALEQIEGVSALPELATLIAQIEFDLETTLSMHWLRPDFFEMKQTTNSTTNLKLIMQKFLAVEKTIAPVWQLAPSQATAQATVEVINFILVSCYDLHRFCLDITDLDIQLPRLGLMQVVEVDEAGLARHELAWSAVEELFESAQSNGLSIASLQVKREERHREWIQKGHEFVFQKKPQEALDAFQKAGELKETAEVLTLIGWAYSQMNQNEKAKAMCLSAIKLDPDYGPPYNDLGTYLLNEGQFNEALKWFELAKKASLYQNKEYPYINAGRAYLAKKDIMNALKEFETALVIAPYHEELKSTVAKLKTNVEMKRNGPKSTLDIDERFPFKQPDGDDSPPVF